jgi:plasmid stability protein
MADLLIRNLEPDIERTLKDEAKRSGNSLFSVAQKLLRQGMARHKPEYGLATEIRNLIPPDCRMDLDIPRDNSDRPPPDFS